MAIGPSTNRPTDRLAIGNPVKFAVKSWKDMPCFRVSVSTRRSSRNESSAQGRVEPEEAGEEAVDENKYSAFPRHVHCRDERRDGGTHSRTHYTIDKNGQRNAVLSKPISASASKRASERARDNDQRDNSTVFLNPPFKL